MPRATASPTSADLHWAAGFLEGDGYFGHASTASCEVEVLQLNREPLDRLQRLFGGSVTTCAMRGMYTRQPYRWRVSGPRARGVMYTLFTMFSREIRDKCRRALGVLPS